MSYKVGQLEQYCKKLKSNVCETDRALTEFGLIHKYWMEISPFVKVEKKSHKLALGKFIKKAKKSSKNMPSFDEGSLSNNGSPKLKKKNKNKKHKKSITGESDHDESSIKEELDTSFISSGKNMKKQKIKIQQEVDDIDENNQSSNIEMKTPKIKKKKIKVKTDQLNVTIETTQEKKKRKLSFSDMEEQSVEHKEDNDSLEDTLNSSVFNSSANADDPNNSCKTLDDKQISKKKRKKKKKSSLNSSNQNLNDIEQKSEVVNDSNIVGDSFSKNSSLKKNKKKSLQMNSSEKSINDFETSIDMEKVDQTGNKKMKKKRALSEMICNEETEFNKDSDNEQPKKKIKKEFIANKSDDEIEQNIAKLERKLKKKLKKRQNKLKGIIAGASLEPELTKFVSNDGSDYSKNSDDESSFPRTPNGKKFVQRFDSEEKNNRTLFVGNLPIGVSKKTIAKAFEPFGEIESVRIRGAVPPKPNMPQKVANIKREYHQDATSISGYVVFTKIEDSEKALELNGKAFNGHHLRVDKAIWKKSPAKPHFNTKASVFIGNLPFEIKDDSLRNVFSKCGSVENVRIIRDRNTGRSKGFGFVEFKDQRSVTPALKLDGTEVNGREIRIKRCEENTTPNKNIEHSRNAQHAGNRIRGKQFKKDGNQSSGNFEKHSGDRSQKKFRKNNDDSGPKKKSFKKMKNIIKSAQEKKKIAAVFKNYKNEKT